jgi:hypothetical protein
LLHGALQPPQFCGLVWVSTQPLEQTVIGALQVAEHWPPLQKGVVQAGLVQPPQWAGSEVTSMQVLPHSTNGLTQPQVPPLQTWPAPQAVAQSPQWLAFDSRSTHSVPQSSKPGLQVLGVVPAGFAQPPTVRAPRSKRPNAEPSAETDTADKRGLRPFMLELLGDARVPTAERVKLSVFF